MGLFNINKEMLSILEAFKREADKRIDRLENINAKSIEAYKGMKAYCEKTKKESDDIFEMCDKICTDVANAIDIPLVLQQINDVVKVICGFSETLQNLEERICKLHIDALNGDAIIKDILFIKRNIQKNSGIQEKQVQSVVDRLDFLEGAETQLLKLTDEISSLRVDLKKAVTTYEFIRKNKDIAGVMGFFRSEKGDGTLFDESQEQLTQIETINKNSEMGKSEYEKIKKDIMAEVESKIEDALVEMHSANMSLYWELMKLLDSDRLVFKYVASFLASVVHLSRLDDKDACERGVKALADKLSSINKVIKVDDSDFNMVRQLAADIEEYDERLRPELDVILAWINTNGD